LGGKCNGLDKHHRVGGVGAPLAEIRDLLGHSTILSTERYAHLAPDTLRTTVAIFDAPASRLGHAGDEGIESEEEISG